MTSGKWIFFLSLILTLTVSCQRSQEDSANISISIQGDLGGQSGQELMHVVVNITGNDISPIFYTWDAHGDNGVQQSPPSSFNFSFPAGLRLVQVAAVYKKTSGSGMDIYYGDSSRDFSAASENLDISVLNINQGLPMISGNISGRYLTGASQGPTGKVEIQYQPPNGKPAMTIEKGFIVNGWFNLFALSGVSLQYKVSDGTILWDGPVSLDSAIFSTSSTKISRISLPVSKRKEYNGGSYSWMAEDSQIYVYGWFGPASSSEIVCQPSSLGYFTRLVNYNTPGLVNGSDPSPSFFLQMNVASTPPTAAQLSNIASASSYAVATYGQTSSGVCSGYTELSNKISLNQSQFDGQGRDGASAFFPPFTKTGSQSSPFAVQASAGQFFISGTFLPNIYPALADGLNIYKRTFNDNWEARDSLFFCSSSAINDAQFSLVSQVGPGLLAGSGILPYTPVLASGEQSYSGSAVLVCPTKNGILLEWGQVMKGNNFF